MNTTFIVAALTVALLGAFPADVSAQGLDGNSAQTIINGDVGSNSQGVLGVNMASGDSNLQSNARAFSAATGPAAAQANVVQTIDGVNFSVPNVTVVQINGGAFNHATGVIGVNQASGAINAQANSVAISLGVGSEVTADAELAQNVTGVAEPMTVTGHYSQATVSGNAFNGTRGLVQVNQSAGVANATGNSFALRVQLGASQ